ncbi:MAG: hypothetical protein JWP66_130 [Naasia sp.]|nr:hypothetical protein [Naasia sp.]
MTLVLGVDAGGTSTRAAIADGSGRILGSGSAGPGNLDDAGPAGTAAAIAEATDAARRAAGIAPGTTFDAAMLGVAGVVSETDRAAVRDAVQSHRLAPAERLEVDHDCRVALAGGLSGRPGIVLIAGTGSAAFGFDAEGQRWRAGGWGGLLGDEGGSYRIAVDALRAVTMAIDGRGPATALTGVLLAALDAADPDDLMHRVHLEGRGRAGIASLAPLVLREAEAGDGVAIDLLDTAAGDLAALVAAVRRRLGFVAPVEAVYVGGLFTADAVLRRVRSALAERAPDVRLVAPEQDPVVGACLLARGLSVG